MTRTFTCATPDCPQEGVPVAVEMTQTSLEDGADLTVSAVTCGGCSEQITDVT